MIGRHQKRYYYRRQASPCFDKQKLYTFKETSRKSSWNVRLDIIEVLRIEIQNVIQNFVGLVSTVH